MKHLFKNIDIDNFTDEDLQLSLQESIKKSTVDLTFKWTEERRILFFKLHLKRGDKTIDLLEGESVNIKTGDRTFPVGDFENGEEIEISYGVFALVPVQKVIAILSQDEPIIAFQASPKDPGITNKIESGEILEDTIKYKVQ